jgi:hypothetical protein
VLVPLRTCMHKHTATNACDACGRRSASRVRAPARARRSPSRARRGRVAMWSQHRGLLRRVAHVARSDRSASRDARAAMRGGAAHTPASVAVRCTRACGCDDTGATIRVAVVGPLRSEALDPHERASDGAQDWTRTRRKYPRNLGKLRVAGHGASRTRSRRPRQARSRGLLEGNCMERDGWTRQRQLGAIHAVPTQAHARAGRVRRSHVSRGAISRLNLSRAARAARACSELERASLALVSASMSDRSPRRVGIGRLAVALAAQIG